MPAKHCTAEWCGYLTLCLGRDLCLFRSLLRAQPSLPTWNTDSQIQLLPTLLSKAESLPWLATGQSPHKQQLHFKHVPPLGTRWSSSLNGGPCCHQAWQNPSGDKVHNGGMTRKFKIHPSAKPREITVSFRASPSLMYLTGICMTFLPPQPTSFLYQTAQK